MPLLSSLYKSFGLSPSAAGIVASSYGTLQWLSAGPLGTLSDKHGRLLALQLSYLGVGVGYIALGQATSVVPLLVSRVLTGSTKHSLNTCKACVADNSSNEERASSIGSFNYWVQVSAVCATVAATPLPYDVRLAGQIGVMIGSPISGTIEKYTGTHTLSCTLAGVLFLINFLLCSLPPMRSDLQHSPAVTRGGTAGRNGTRPGPIQMLHELYQVFMTPLVSSLFMVCQNLR